MDKHIITGKIGEELATNLLTKKGYKILETNYVCNIGEIDIIAKLESVIVFVEVKTSSSLKYGLPKERINYKKINKIKNVATCYLKYKGLLNKVSVRFDCIEIVGDSLDYKIEHIENIF